MNGTFEKWYPHHDLDTMYDVDGVWMGPEGLSMVLLPDGARRKELEGQRLTVTWESIHAYQLSQESYREDVWICDPKQAWSFWTSTDSAYLRTFWEGSALFPKNAVHWLFVGTNLIVDVTATEPPTICVMTPSKEHSRAHRKEIEVQGCVEVPMELSQDEFYDRFIHMIEANRWSFGGGMRTIVDGRYIHEDGTCGELLWPEDDDE